MQSALCLEAVTNSLVPRLNPCLVRGLNPLLTNDAPMRHDLSELHKLMGIYMGVLILGAILQYMVSAYLAVSYGR